MMWNSTCCFEARFGQGKQLCYQSNNDYNSIILKFKNVLGILNIRNKYADLSEPL